MTERKVGNCLVLYLENLATFGALEASEDMPPELKADADLIVSFRERSSEQAASLLEGVHGAIDSGSAIPYRTDRRTQRRTVRDRWYIEGRIFRPRERIARSYWSLSVSSLRDKGPSLCVVVGPSDASGTAAIDLLSVKVAQQMGWESANARTCFAEAGYGAGLLIGACPLKSGMAHDEVSAALSTQLSGFFEKFRTELETSLDA